MIEPIIVLNRTCWDDEMGTFGWMMIGGKRIRTVERPWASNAPMVSCIPQGSYLVERHTSPKFGACWILSGGSVAKTPTEVDANPRYLRSLILIHAANKSEELQGCIAPGLSLGCLDGKWAVFSSRDALRHMDAHLPDRWTLIIKGSLS